MPDGRRIWRAATCRRSFPGNVPRETDKRAPARALAILLAVLLLCAACSKSPHDKEPPALPGSAGEVSGERATAKGGGSPFLPYLRLAEKTTAAFQKNIHDYSAILDSSERVKDEVQHRRLSIKIRHEPFSVYAKVLEPADRTGEEAIYVAGKNDGKVMVHTTGMTGWALGTMSLDLTSSLLMKNQRHPMTDIGILNLCRQWVSGIQRDVDCRDCQVHVTRGVKLDDRVCTRYEIVHPSTAALSVPRGADLLRRPVPGPDPLRGLRLAQGPGRRTAAVGAVLVFADQVEPEFY